MKRDKNKTNSSKRLSQLRVKQYPMTFKQKSNISLITNLSKRILTNGEISILESGLNFVLPAKRFDEKPFINNIQTSLCKLSTLL